MTAETYRRLAAPFREKPARLKALRWTGAALTYTGAAAYFALLALCLARSDTRYLLRAVLIPGAGFCLFTLIRAKIDAPRPYELYSLRPLIPRDKKGCSFPSRHIFSMSVIAASWFGACVPAAVVLTVFAALLAVIRVVSAVHFPRDVIVGFAAGVLFGAAVSLPVFC